MKKYIKYALFAVFGFVVSSVVFTVGNNNTYKVYNNDSDKIKILKNASNNKEENLKLDLKDEYVGDESIENNSSKKGIYIGIAAAIAAIIGAGVMVKKYRRR